MAGGLAAFAFLDMANTGIDIATSTRNSDLWNSLDTSCKQMQMLKQNLSDLDAVNAEIAQGIHNADTASKLIEKLNLSLGQQQTDLDEKQRKFKIKLWSTHIRNISIVTTLGILIFFKLYKKN